MMVRTSCLFEVVVALLAALAQTTMGAEFDETGYLTDIKLDEDRTADIGKCRSQMWSLFFEGSSHVYVRQGGHVHFSILEYLYDGKNNTMTTVPSSQYLATISWDGDQLVVEGYDDEFAEEGFLCYYNVVVPAGSVLGRKGQGRIDEVGHLTVMSGVYCSDSFNDLWFIRSGDVVVAGLSSGTVDARNSTAASMTRPCVMCRDHLDKQTMYADADGLVHINGQCSATYYVKEGTVLGAEARSHAGQQRQLRGSKA